MGSDAQNVISWCQRAQAIPRGSLKGCPAPDAVEGTLRPVLSTAFVEQEKERSVASRALLEYILFNHHSTLQCSCSHLLPLHATPQQVTPSCTLQGGHAP